ncbi:tRNA lysidine(34) synthetase TilS [Akkermansiaceae bacterium]|nr:tRNA lysidine(34) synthetase TilS [Akkermansiaceae bacterium]
MAITLHSEFLAKPSDTPYLLAISGGRDSVVLLHLLLDAGFKNIVLCHINHGLRGEESDQDAAFIQQLANQNNLVCEITQANVQQRIDDTGESLELAARNTRHEYFAACAQKHSCYDILLAHHADDQAETILFNLLRGSSGLRGMSYSTTHHLAGEELQFIRPLLFTPRQQINDYIAVHNISYREDSSNTEAIAVRNRLRNEAIPLLREIMGRDISPAINRAAATSESQELALRETISTLQTEDPQGRLYLPIIKKLPKAFQHIILHDYLKKHDISGINYHLLDQCFCIINEEGSSKINLPGDQFFRRKEQRAFIQ